MTLLALLLFLPVGTLDYWQGWVVWSLCFINTLAMTGYFLKTDPAFLERRLRAGPAAEGQKSQKVIIALLSGLSVALLLASSFEYRFLSPSLSTVVVLAGQVSLAFGFLLIFLVFRENRFAASTVTVEANQTVISSGLYGLVRHPMYFAGVFVLVGTPLGLGAPWSVLFGVAGVLLLAVRLLKEEQFLLVQLPGYRAYCEKVRYHLVPYVW